MCNITNNAAETALFKAAEEGNAEIAMKLLPLMSSHHDMRARDGSTPLHTAVSHGHTDVIKKLLDRRPELLMQADHFGRTPLHNIAYVKKSSKIAKLLLEKDISLSYKVDNNHQSALHIVVVEENVDLVKEILKYAPQCFEIVDKDGRNVIHLVAQNAIEIFAKIKKNIKNLVLELMASKELINGLDNHGKTPLDIVLEKMSNDEHLYSGGARNTPKMVEEEALGRSLATEKQVEQNQIVVVSAVLIATVAFQAAFTFQGKYDQDELFVIFVLCDSLAFCNAIATALLMFYATYGNQEDSLLVKTSIKGLWIASSALVGAFASFIAISIYSEHRWIAQIAIWMTFGAFQVILVMFFRSKRYTFREEGTYVAVIIILVDYSVAVFPGPLMSAIWTTLLLGWQFLPALKEFGQRGRIVIIVLYLGLLAQQWTSVFM
ncbi:hypothetical protein SUGI_0972840 [Cryptomeria japonica]|nr:hypothetical protein SUGI_0972840 [Cryptomeria japonica]